MIRSPFVSVLVLFALGCSKGSTSSDPSGAASASSPTSGIVGALKNAIAPNSQPFEGEIAIQVVESSRPAPQTMVLQLKAQKIRFNTDTKAANGQQASGIIDLKEKKMITLLDAQKKYMEIDFGNFNPSAVRGMPPTSGASGPTATSNATPPKIDKTGHHETVAGHDCEDWNLVEGSTGHKALMCMASDIGAFDFGSMEGASFLPSFLKGGLFGGAVFPIKLVDFDDAGKEKAHMEATRIERKAEDDANFTPPAGYTK